LTKTVESLALLAIGGIAAPVRTEIEGLGLDVRHEIAAMVGDRRRPAVFQRFELQPNRAGQPGGFLAGEQTSQPVHHSARSSGYAAKQGGQETRNAEECQVWNA